MFHIIIVIVLTLILYLIIRKRRENNEKESISLLSSNGAADSIESQSKLGKTWFLIKDNFWIIAAVVLIMAFIIILLLEPEYKSAVQETKPVTSTPDADYPPTGLKTVELKEVPDSNRAVKIILKNDNVDPEDARFFYVAWFDINSDGKDDLLYTFLGYTGSCGNSWGILLNQGNGKYEASRYIIDCTGEKLEFAEETINGLRIPYFEGKKIEYNVLRN